MPPVTLCVRLFRMRVQLTYMPVRLKYLEKGRIYAWATWAIAQGPHHLRAPTSYIFLLSFTVCLRTREEILRVTSDLRILSGRVGWFPLVTPAPRVRFPVGSVYQRLISRIFTAGGSVAL